MPSILIVDDNPEILTANSSHLSDEGFGVTIANTGVKAIVCLNEKQYDCIILDIMLPDIDGFSLCKAVRTITSAPIIFLTCLDAMDDKIKGLMSGADDYITKPYSLKELTARIYVLLRRERWDGQHSSLGKVYIDKKNKMIHTPERNVFLSQKEFELFLLLFENSDMVFSKEEIFKALWPNGTDIGTVAVHILKLRRKLDIVKAYIGTIKNDYKSGYYIAQPDTDEVH